MSQNRCGPSSEDRGQEFEKLLAANAARMKRYCAKWVAHRADEAFSRATFIAFRKFAQCNANSSAWLMRVTRNVCMDLHREESRRRTEPLGDDPDATLAVDAGIDPESAFLQREQTAILFRCLSRLPARLRDPLLLHAMHGFDHARIAEMLSITNACARKRISEARAALRRCARGGRRRDTTSQADWWLAGERMAAEVARRAADASLIPIAVATSVVRVRRRDGSEHDVTLFHETPPTTITAARIEQLRRHVERHRTGYTKSRELARVLRDAGRFEDAIPHYEHVLARRPDLAATALELSAVYRHLGDTARASDALRRVLPRPADAPLLAAERARVEGEHARALALLDDALDATPARGDLLLLRAETLLDLGRAAEAVGAFDEAIAARPGDVRALLGSRDAKNHSNAGVASNR